MHTGRIGHLKSDQFYLYVFYSILGLIHLETFK